MSTAPSPVAESWQPFWIPDDLVSHGQCDFAVARQIIRRRESTDALTLVAALDPTRGSLTQAHEEQVLDDLVREFGWATNGSRSGVRQLSPPGTPHAVEHAIRVEETIEAVASGADAIHRPAVSIDNFRGGADFLVRTEDGWAACDARLSTVAPAEAVMMLMTISDAMERCGIRVAPYVSFLGKGLSERRWQRPSLKALYERQRGRVTHLVELLGATMNAPSSIEDWARFRRCGACEACAGTDESRGVGSYQGEHPAQATGSALPTPRPGDLFVHHEVFRSVLPGERSVTVLATLSPQEASEGFALHWAENWQEERDQAAELLRQIREALAADGHVHVFHRGPQVLRHLMRMTAPEPELWQFVFALRTGLPRSVFVDLDDLEGETQVVAGAEYANETGLETATTHGLLARFLFLAEALGKEQTAADLRDQLVASASAACDELVGLRDRLLEQRGSSDVPAFSSERYRPTLLDSLADDLRWRLGTADRFQRSPEDDAYAMLASAMNFYERERTEFDLRARRWERFPPAAWRDDPEVVVFREPPVEISPPALTKHGALVRRMSGVAMLDPRSRVQPGDMVARLPGSPSQVARGRVTYEPMSARCVVRDIVRSSDDETVVIFDQYLYRGDTEHDTPVALVPQDPPYATKLNDSLREIGNQVNGRQELPRLAVIDLLTRRPPRLSSRMPLPRTSNRTNDVMTAVQDLDGSYVAVQGPPGSGKTRLGATVVRRLVEEGWRIGVVAQSHATVDHFLGSAVKRGLDPEVVAKKRAQGSRPQTQWKQVKDLADFAETHGNGCLVGGTAWAFATQGFDANPLDLLVIEEAGQYAMAHTIAVSPAARNLLLLGDPQQLPGVTQGVHDEPVHESALAWLMRGSATLPEEYGYFLERTYRMHPSVSDPVSVLAYDGRLTADPAASQRRLVGIEPGVVRVDVEHRGNRVASIEEADEVVNQVQSLLGTKWLEPSERDYLLGLQERDVLVVAPYNAQVNLIRQCLDEAGHNGVSVGTVDKFQGREAPVVIMSMTSSTLDETSRAADFLLDPKRLNVAVSRAKWLALIICSRDFLDRLPPDIEDLKNLAAFAQLGAGRRAEPD